MCSIGAAALLGGLIGCSSGSSDSVDTGNNTPSGEGESNDAVLTGVFVDSPVRGLGFATETRSGTTDAEGQFEYLAGESVTFSVGDARLPTVEAAEQITPVDVARGSEDPTATAVNIARLLQSLDLDGDPTNGIEISASAASGAAVIDFDVSAEAFAEDTAVINLVANSGSVTTMLIDSQQALDHLNLSLDDDLSLDTSGDMAGVNDIVLDLRGTTWVESRETGCDGMLNRVTLTYSQTNLSVTTTRAEDQGNGCAREDRAFDMIFTDWAGTSAFILVCGGDALCTLDELNRTVEVPVGDPRNDCTQDGVAVPVTHRVLHVAGSGRIVSFNCDPNDEDIYVMQ